MHTVKWLKVLLFNANYSIHSFVHKWFQVQLCITNNSIKQSFVYTVKWSVLFQAIQISISHLFAHSLNNQIIYGSNRTNLSGPGSNSNEGVLCIPQFSKAGGSPSDGLMSYPRHPEMQSVYSTATPSSRLSLRSFQLTGLKMSCVWH